jgi:hypothetical protein
MQRSLAVALFLALSLISALALPADVVNGHYPGRSGDFVLRQKGYAAGQAYLTLLSKNVELAQASLPETSVADLIAHLMGVAPLNPAANRENFPRVNFLELPRANVLFFVQSSSASGDVALTSEAYPSDSIARLTTILTGSNPSEHGIIQRAWYDQVQREIVSAYSSEYAGARAASLQDVVTAAFAGNSLVVSAATCRMVASALAAKSAVLPAAANNHALYWSSESQKFASVYADVADKLAFSFADVEAFAASLGSYDAATKRLSVEGVEFDLSTKDVGFFAELSFVHSLVAQLKTDERLKALVADKASDFFTFAISFRGLEHKYGAESVQVRAAHSILTTTISFATEEINALYNGRAIAEIVSATPSSHITEELVEQVQTAAAADSVFFNKKVYPQVYLVNWLSNGETQSEAVCSHLSSSLTNFEVHCAEGTMSALAVARLSEGDEVMRMLVGNGTSGGATSDDIATFQIVIWTSVMLIFAALAASVVMASVHDTTDSVIYNSPALHAKSS